MLTEPREKPTPDEDNQQLCSDFDEDCFGLDYAACYAYAPECGKCPFYEATKGP